RLSKEGNLSFISKNGHFVKLNKDVYDSCLKHDEVCLEVEEQYQKFKELANRKPDYMEGHALLHTVYLKAIEVVAKKHNVLFIPSLIHHDDALMIKEIPLYFWMESMSDNYHPMQCFQKICSNRREGCEVMILHPGYIDTYLCENSSLLKAREMEVEFIMHLDNIVSDKDNIEFVTYKDFVRGVKF
ncbi:MAG: ChbG/HpnK family deacetylase, partial [Longicatena sp.]